MLFGLDAVTGKTLWKFQTGRRHRGRRHDLHDQRRAVRPGDRGRRQAVGVQARRQPEAGFGQQRDADAGAVRRAARGGRHARSKAAPSATRSGWRARTTTDAAGLGRQHRHRRHDPDAPARAGRHDGDVREPGPARRPELPEHEGALRDAVLRGPVQSQAAPGPDASSTRSRRKASTSTTTAPTRVRPARWWRITSRRIVPGALQFVPRTLEPATGQRRLHQRAGSGHGDVQASGRLHARRQGVQAEDAAVDGACSRRSRPSTTADGKTLIATFDKALIDNNMPAGACGSADRDRQLHERRRAEAADVDGERAGREVSSWSVSADVAEAPS